jgi:hypothetical protein
MLYDETVGPCVSDWSDTEAGAATVTATVPVSVLPAVVALPADVAVTVIVALPGAIAVTTPVLLTVAMFVFDDENDGVGTVIPAAVVTVAVI